VCVICLIEFLLFVYSTLPVYWQLSISFHFKLLVVWRLTMVQGN